MRATPADPGAATTAGQGPHRARREGPRATASRSPGRTTVAEAEKRLVLDWTQPLRHPTFYKAVFRPAVLRANRNAGEHRVAAGFEFHSLRHTYASLCVAVIWPSKLSGRMGHANVGRRWTSTPTCSPTTTRRGHGRARGAGRAEADLRRKRCTAARLTDCVAKRS